MKKTYILSILAVYICLLTGCSRQITEQEALDIALSHVGLSENLVTFTEVELDTDDVNHHYDVEFHTANQQKYHYEIDSSNGKILEWDVDLIHDNTL